VDAAQALEVPGVAVGVYLKGEQHYAVYGVTSVENPMPVDEDTAFAIGSIGKTFTATAIMQLVEAGQLDLRAPVRRYVPELRLRDQRVAEEVTVLHLLNHTAGWEGDRIVGTGEGDDALPRYVETLADLPQLSPLGSEPAYNNAAVKLAGRVIESVTGQSYEDAIMDRLMRPLGLEHTWLRLGDIITRRFSCGHTHRADGTTTVCRPWDFHRCEVPAGGRIAASVRDQIAWARFHLGPGNGSDGVHVLSEESLRQMQQPTSGTAPGPRFGLIWALRDLEGSRLVEHSGAQPGQYSMLSMAPEHDFALSVLVNSGPNGQELRADLVRWAFATYLGLVERIPEPLEATEDQLAPCAGTYATDMATVRVEVSGDGLRFIPGLRDEVAVQAEGLDQIPVPLPFRVGLLPDDEFLVLDGPFRDERGRFVRESGVVTSIHWDRLMPRIADANAAG
jgi:CubicO group peptidase (beta-lactamase class C family)